jgi:hypothetical protein
VTLTSADGLRVRADLLGRLDPERRNQSKGVEIKHPSGLKRAKRGGAIATVESYSASAGINIERGTGSDALDGDGVRTCPE